MTRRLRNELAIGLLAVTLLIAGAAVMWHVTGRVPDIVNGPWERPGADRISALEGKTDAQVTMLLGKPDSATEFLMDTVHDEFRIGLFNTYPPNGPKSSNVRIREWRWSYRYFNVAVWLHFINGQWQVLNTCRWKHDTKF